MSNQQYQSISLLSKCFKIQNNTKYSINISTLLHKFYSYCMDFMCGIQTKHCLMKTWVPAASNHSLSPLCECLYSLVANTTYDHVLTVQSPNT